MYSGTGDYRKLNSDTTDIVSSFKSLAADIQFEFRLATIDPNGNFAVVDGISAPGNYVDVSMELDVIFVISNCPQVNNPCNGFNPTPIRVLIWDMPPS